ncbi:MAG TPA: hypothetical protein VFY90_12800, partial [Tepidiformaceae bacterium]|nr:hypothetical protein [Tepidiformaceae bacterium]
IVEMLNAFHEGEEMYLPYTTERLRSRVCRAPRQYSWSNLWLTEGAVAGGWPSGESIAGRFTGADGVVEEARETNILDYGCLPGHEDELLGLLRAWCGYTADRGWQDVLIFSSQGSRSLPIIGQLEAALSAFDFWTPRLPEPPGAAYRGLYVDPIYF